MIICAVGLTSTFHTLNLIARCHPGEIDIGYLIRPGIGHMVTLPNSDGRIWNLSQKTIEMIVEYQQSTGLTISLNQEGPCAESLGLFDLLDDLCDRFGWEKSRITIITNNVLEHHPHYVIKRNGPGRLDSVKTFCKNNKLPPKCFDGIKHFGLFIGRSSWMRLWLASVLQQDFMHKTMMTFHYDGKLQYHRPYLGLDEMILWLGQQNHVIKKAANLIEKCPILLEDELTDYPIITPAHFSIGKLYHKFFVEIVCETYCQGKTFFPTEKTWRPIACKTPFIIQGPKNYYNNLRKMGFKTFSNWWDEGFTEDSYDYQPHEIIKVIDRISKMSVEELEGLYIDMESTLEHNYLLLQELLPRHFVETFSQI